MTNFILNTNKIKALAGTLILTGNISQTMAVPCFRLFGNNRETYTVSDEILDDGKIEKIELDSKKYISVKDFGLKDEDGEIIDIVELKGKGNSDSKDTDKEENNSEARTLMTEEEFDKLVSDAYDYLVKDKEIQLNKSQLTSWLMQANILSMPSSLITKVMDSTEVSDKELENISGDEELSELLALKRQNDGYEVFSLVVSYNERIWGNTGKTSDLVKSSEFIFDPVEKAKAQKIEAYIDRMLDAAYVFDSEGVKKVFDEFWDKYYDPTNDMAAIYDDSRYAVQLYMKPMGDFKARGVVDDDTADKIQYFVTPYGADSKYVNNNFFTGAVGNIYGIMKRGCSEIIVATYTAAVYPDMNYDYADNLVYLSDDSVRVFIQEESSKYVRVRHL